MSAYFRLLDKKDSFLQNQVKTLVIIKFDSANIYCKFNENYVLMFRNDYVLIVGQKSDAKPGEETQVNCVRGKASPIEILITVPSLCIHVFVQADRMTAPVEIA